MFSIGEIFALLVVGSWTFGKLKPQIAFLIPIKHLRHFNFIFSQPNCIQATLIIIFESFSGPKELPKAGRSLGRLTGHATGLLYRARAQLFQFAEKTELTKVQQEVQATMYQLQAIRSELQGGINILDPGPLTRKVLGAAAPSLQNNQPPDSPFSQQGNIGSTPINRNKNPAMDMSFAANGVTSQQATYQSAQSSMPQSSDATSCKLADLLVAAQPQPINGPSTLLTEQRHPTFDGSGSGTISADSSTDNDTLYVIPISAVQAGLVPDRIGSIPTGSEILSDALQEERVAHQARAFFKQQGLPTMVPHSPKEDPMQPSLTSGRGTADNRNK